MNFFIISIFYLDNLKLQIQQLNEQSFDQVHASKGLLIITNWL